LPARVTGPHEVHLRHRWGRRKTEAAENGSAGARTSKTAECTDAGTASAVGCRATIDHPALVETKMDEGG